MVVAMGYTDDGYEAWALIAMPRTHTGSVAVTHRVLTLQYCSFTFRRSMLFELLRSGSRLGGPLCIAKIKYNKVDTTLQ